jgi:hypothetical protein
VLSKGDRDAETETPAWFGESPLCAAFPYLANLKDMREALEEGVRRQMSKEPNE